MSRWCVTVWYKDGGSSLHVVNHQNTAIRIADEMRRAAGSRRVDLYEEARPCTSQDIKQRARALTATLRAEESSSDTSLSGLYAWWHSQPVCCSCEEGTV